MSIREKLEFLKAKKGKEEEKINLEELLLENQSSCVHSKNESNTFEGMFKAGSSMIGARKKKLIMQHTSSLEGFAERIISYKDAISLDIYETFMKNNPKADAILDSGSVHETFANTRIMEYFDFITNVLNNSNKYKGFITKSKSRNNVQIVSEKLQNYVLLKICNEIKAYNDLEKRDNEFHKKCISLQFIDPIQHLKIKNEILSQDQLDIAQNCLARIDKEKNCNKILGLISNCIEVIQKMINFSSGKNDIGVDDFIQILVYLTIKSKPKSLISQIANCRYFLQGIIEKEKRGFDLSNLEVAVEFILDVSYTQIGLESQEEFDRLTELSLEEEGNNSAS